MISGIKQGFPPAGGAASPHGVLNVDKEVGPSSNAVLQRLRSLLGGVKAGHAGTLDPGAGGVLLVLLGEATKLMPFVSPLAKEYVGKMEFGSSTDTHDAHGRTVATASTEHLTRALVESRMQSLCGETLQIPPMFSAAKVNGEKLYRLARRGQEVPRAPRKIVLHEFFLLDWKMPVLEFRVRCGSGTYVRTLCHDLARACGSQGHMTALTRTSVGPFRLEAALTLADLQAMVGEGAALPLTQLADALPHLPAMTLTAEETAEARRGMRLVPSERLAGERLEPGTDVKLVDGRGRLVAVVRYEGTGVEMPFRRVFTDV